MDVAKWFCATSSLFVRIADEELRLGGYSVMLLISALCCLFIIASRGIDLCRGIDAPVAGRRFAWEPSWSLRLRFPFQSRAILQSGYDRFKDQAFRILRPDGDVLVLPSRYVKQLGNLSSECASSSQGQIRNMAGRWSTCEAIVESNVHFQAVQKNLTRNIETTIPGMKLELDIAFRNFLPACKHDWSEVYIFDKLAVIAAQVSMHVFVGPELCRDEAWLKNAVDYDINVGTTVHILRMFPSIMHPLLARTMPSWYQAHGNIRTAERIVSGVMQERRKKSEQQGFKSEDLPKDLFQWIWNALDDEDVNPYSMARHILILGLASIHTTSMAASHILYDLCANPEYFQPLRDEILQILRVDGGWNRHTLNKLAKLDSFLKESQRFSPPSLMSFNRILRKPLTLDDGLYLPAGTHIAVASDPILRDSRHCQNPDKFDGFRFYRMRQERGDMDGDNRHQFVAVDSTNLHFGGGRHACPGRFFSCALLKLVVCHLLLRYDFKYPRSSGRPRNFHIHENIFPDPKAKLMIRERKTVKDDIEETLTVNKDLANKEAFRLS